MPTLQGVSDDGVPRLLEIELHDAEIYLRTHPPGGGFGQEVLLPRGEFVEAVNARRGTVSGVSPVLRRPKLCEIDNQPEGLRFKIHPESGSGSWWVIVNAVDVANAMNQLE